MRSHWACRAAACAAAVSACPRSRWGARCLDHPPYAPPHDTHTLSAHLLHHTHPHTRPCGAPRTHNARMLSLLSQRIVHPCPQPLERRPLGARRTVLRARRCAQPCHGTPPATACAAGARRPWLPPPPPPRPRIARARRTADASQPCEREGRAGAAPFCGAAAPLLLQGPASPSVGPSAHLRLAHCDIPPGAQGRATLATSKPERFLAAPLPLQQPRWRARWRARAARSRRQPVALACRRPPCRPILSRRANVSSHW